MGKKISVCISCYNEEQNVIPLCKAIREELAGFPQYDYEIILADNGSGDGTLHNLKALAKEDRRIKVIVNNHNFGPGRSAANCVARSSGDAVIGMAADFQDPPGLIPELIRAWEAGSLVVLGQKRRTEERGFLCLCREGYYKLVKALAEYPPYDQVTGFGLQDRSVVDLINSLNEKNMPTRNLIAELGYEVTLIPYDQPARKKGKSSFNFLKYADYAINSIVRSSRLPLRLITLTGGVLSVLIFMATACGLLYQLGTGGRTDGQALAAAGMLFLGCVQIFCLGIVGEYIGALLNQVVKRPLVVERETYNFEEENG